MCDWVGAVCVSVCSGVSVGVACADAGKVGHGPPALDLAATADPKDSISEGEKRVTIWNPFEKRKLSGAKLLHMHPHCAIYSRLSRTAPCTS